MGKVQDPKGYKKIRTHFVFDVKNDGRHKARLLSAGNLADILLSSDCLGMASLR